MWKTPVLLLVALSHVGASTRPRQVQENDVYDFIIVGGGTAGPALATRLSQNLPDASILLLEAGPLELDDVRINAPGLKGSGVRSVFDWNFTTVPQAATNNRVWPAARGKVLGGSSALNYLLWNRATEAEYDSWDRLGNPGWNWDTLSAGMMRSNNFSGVHSQDYDDGGAGVDGPIDSVFGRWRPRHQELWIPTMENLGFRHNRNSLGGDNQGAMNQPYAINPSNWHRSYSTNAYLPLAGPNLDVVVNRRVSRVNFEATGAVGAGRDARYAGPSRRATGVRLEDGSLIEARREVILSAGTVQSPGLLELSGIGQGPVLNASGVRQIVDLPGVGENLQDHVRVGLSFQLRPGYLSLDALRYNSTYAAQQMALWRNGSLSHYDYTGNGIAFVDFPQAVGDETAGRLLSLADRVVANSTHPVNRAKLDLIRDASVQEIEVLFTDGATGPRGYPAGNTTLYGRDFFTLYGILMQPLSRGSIHIRSSNISVDPVIDPRYLSNEHDLQAAVELAKFIRRLGQTEPLAGAVAAEYDPGQEVQTDEQWLEFVRAGASTINHLAGTCAMLPREDGGVVDPSLRVYGTENLRVVDMSIAPLLVAGHSQTLAYGIAERAAEIMIEEYRAG